MPLRIFRHTTIVGAIEVSCLSQGGRVIIANVTPHLDFDTR
jgi:hypothetical protein